MGGPGHRLDLTEKPGPDLSMTEPEKACPVVIRSRGGRVEILAFRHPLAGTQIVKGTIGPGEAPVAAAWRELREESGLAPDVPMVGLGTCAIGPERRVWHFFLCRPPGLAETWTHFVDDDGGHRFAFFWHRMDVSPDQTWHPAFHEALAYLAPRLADPEALAADFSGPG